MGGAGGGSTNHAWSGGTLTVISQYLCGVEPLEPAYSVFKIEPNPASFKKASITIPTVTGTIKSAFESDAENFILKVTVPFKTHAVVYLPKSAEGTVLINGKKPTGGYANVASEYRKDTKVCYQLPAGEYILITAKN